MRRLAGLWEMVVTGVSFGFLMVAADAQVPGFINYQGRLVNGTNLVNAVVDMEIALWTNAVGPGAPLCIDSGKVTVVDGVYATWIGDNIILGNLTNALRNPEVFLSARINGTWLFPRENIGAVAYSLLADGVKTGGILSFMLADGAVRSNNIAAGSVTALQLANSAVTSSKIEVGAIHAAHIATGAVDHAQLARDYQAGTINLVGMSRTNLYNFQQISTNVSVSFAPAFEATPVVTLGVESLDRLVATQITAYVLNKSATTFTAQIDFPAGARVLDTNRSWRYLSAATIGGCPAVAYQSDEDGSLKFMRASDAFGLTWNAPVTVITNRTSGTENALMEFNGAPVIAYVYARDFSGGDLMFIRAWDAAGTNWAAPLAIDTNVEDHAVYPSICQVENRPAVSYCQKGKLAYARADDDYGSNWVRETVFTNVNSGLFSSLEVVNGNPAIAFYDDTATTDYVKYIRATDTYGDDWWSFATTVATNVNAEYISLRMAGGSPAVSFYDYSDACLKFFRAANSTGGSWRFSDRVVVVTNGGGSYARMGTVYGYPAIAYACTAEDEVRYIRAANTLGASWDTPVTASRVGLSAAQSWAVAAGTPAVFFVDDAVKHLKYVRSGTAPTNAAINWIAVEP